MGMGRLGPPGATCSEPPDVALEATFYRPPLIRHSRWPSSLPIFERLLCCRLVGGALDIPTPSEQLFIEFPAPMTPVSCEHRGPSISQAAGQAHLPVPLTSSRLLGLLRLPAPPPLWPATVLSLPVPCTEHTTTTTTIHTVLCPFLHEVNAVFPGALWEGR